jgi:hypothetical protein
MGTFIIVFCGIPCWRFNDSLLLMNDLRVRFSGLLFP